MSKQTVPKELYDELLEKYEELLRENERLKNTPNVYPQTMPTMPTIPTMEPRPKIWMGDWYGNIGLETNNDGFYQIYDQPEGIKYV